MPLRIPEQFQPQLRKFAEAPEDEQSAFVSGIRGLEPLSGRRKIEGVVQETRPSLSQGEISAFIDVLISLASQRRHRSPERVGVDIAASRDLELPPSTQERFADVVTALVNAPALTSLARSFYVTFEHQNIYEEAQILTELRPVFDDEVSDVPLGGVILSMLSLTYFSADQTTKLQVAMDEDDLHELKRVVDRALLKVRATKSWLSQNKISYFDYLEES